MHPEPPSNAVTPHSFSSPPQLAAKRKREEMLERFIENGRDETCHELPIPFLRGQTHPQRNLLRCSAGHLPWALQEIASNSLISTSGGAGSDRFGFLQGCRSCWTRHSCKPWLNIHCWVPALSGFKPYPKALGVKPGG